MYRKVPKISFFPLFFFNVDSSFNIENKVFKFSMLIISRRNAVSFLQLQNFWTCFCVLVTFSMLCTETSEISKKLIYFDLSGRFSKR